MSTHHKVLSISRDVKEKELADGHYAAIWSGHEVRFENRGVHYRCQTDIGVRGEVKAYVIINGGELTVIEHKMADDAR